MTKKIKLGVLGFTAVTAATLPLVLSVSCGSEGTTDGQHVDAVYNDGDTRDGDITFSTPEERVSAQPSLRGTGGSNRLGLQAQYILDAPDHTTDDLSFNQQGDELMTEMPDMHGIADITSGGYSIIPTTTELDTTYDTIARSTVMLLAGENHVAPLTKYATNPNGDMVTEEKYAVLLDGDVNNPRVASLIFDTKQAGFQAGVQAGLYLNVKKTKFLQNDNDLKVATFGGMDIENVVSYMAGFQKGIEFFNEHNNTNEDIFPLVQYGLDVHMIDNGARSDYFTGNFEKGGATDMANKLIDKGADLIFPVAGQQTSDVVNVIKSRSSSTSTCKAQVIGIDMKQETLPEFSTRTSGEEADIVTNSYVAFSVVKDIKRAFKEELVKIIGGTNVQAGINGLGGLTIGDLDNGLVYVSVGQATSVSHLSKNQEVIDAAKVMESKFRF